MRNMHSPNETQILVNEIEAGLTRASVPINDFCVAAHINRATWQRWKSGKHSPHPSMKPGIMAAFDSLVAKAKERAA